MAGAKATKNADGAAKKAALNPTGGAAAAPGVGQAPNLVPPGAPPMPPQGMPPGAPAGPDPSGGMLGGPPMQQVRSTINFRDMPPMDQMQAMQHQGIDPAAPLKMMQGQLQSSLQQPQDPGNPIPNAFAGPGVPPGNENFPHDFAALLQTMQHGYSPGADAGSHAMAQNAHSMIKAHMDQASQLAAHDQLKAMAQSQAMASPQGQALSAITSPPPGVPADKHLKNLKTTLGQV